MFTATAFETSPERSASVVSAAFELPLKRSPKRSGQRVLAVLLALLIACSALLRWPDYSHTEICRQCAMRRDTFVLRTRLAGPDLHEFQLENPTLVHRALAEIG
ncbi:MAG: hypothetical protein ABI024_04470, partial [Vicinamibacterales bacterium]